MGYAVLAEVVAAASGRAYSGFVNDEVLRPAGMAQGVIVDGTAADVAELSQGYSPGPGPLDVAPAIDAPLELGASGLVATADDLALWVEGLAKGAYPDFFRSRRPARFGRPENRPHRDLCFGPGLAAGIFR